jgi:uncharacterized RDD family membrane protein YckC
MTHKDGDRAIRILKEAGYQISLIVVTLIGLLAIGVAIPVFVLMGAIALVTEKKK